MEISKETTDYVLSFSEDRDWKQFHNPKDLALSLSLEASELLELFQWLRSDEAVGFEDLDALIMDKMKKNEEKYPLSKAKGSNKKYTEL